jgi:hypothetical protein
MPSSWIHSRYRLSSRSVRICFLTTACFAFAACAASPVVRLPLSISAPGLERQAGAVPIEMILLRAPEWLELKLHSTSREAVEVDFSGAVLIDAAGRHHPLISLTQLHRNAVADESARSFASDSPLLTAEPQFTGLRHGSPLAQQSALQLVGRRPFGELLFLAGNVNRGGADPMTPLLGAPDEGMPFQVLLPIRIGGVWHVVSLDANATGWR